MATISFRNSVTGRRVDIEARDGDSVHDCAKKSGLVDADADFNVRDRNGNIIDGNPATQYSGETLNLGLPGEQIAGGSHHW